MVLEIETPTAFSGNKRSDYVQEKQSEVSRKKILRRPPKK